MAPVLVSQCDFEFHNQNKRMTDRKKVSGWVDGWMDNRWMSGIPEGEGASVGGVMR
jgi:hypothetical protein